ncbi:hypothetical protein H4582DRAFT_2075741 [Lactarius indigo]|nr:hypothetical protein H4582DRAFT_2075741 [Lactarius indigo]
MSEHSDSSATHSGQDSRPMPPTKEGFVITPQDATILRGYMDDFEQADTQMRKNILEKAMGELYRRQPANSVFDKKDARQKIRKWFYNHYSPPHRQVIKFTRRWSARNVFYHEDKAHITVLAEEMSGAVPGTQEFLGALQEATTELWKKLPIEEQERFAETAKEWSDNGPPKGIQAKMASAAIRGWIVRDFQTQLYRTCGARSIVLLAYQKEDGTPQVSMDEWNAGVDEGLDFGDFCPNWRTSVLWDKWKKYGRQCFGLDDDQGAEKNHARTLKAPVQITTDVTGEPEIPSIVKGGGHQAKVVQTALRDYCTAHIRFISGKRNLTIPWAKLSTAPTAWIEEECYPPGFQWADPSKIRLDDVHDLLIYWRQRKEDGLTPLIWNPSCELLAEAEKTSEHLPTQRRCQTPSTSNPDEEEEDFARDLNKISDHPSLESSPLQILPSLHAVQKGPSKSNTEHPARVGVESTECPEPPSVPQHSSYLHGAHGSNAPPSETAPTELTQDPARGLSTHQDTPGQRMALLQVHHGSTLASTSGHMSEDQPPHSHSLGKRQIKKSDKAK